ncbi:MAG: hypothetical protein ACRDL7_00270, partial [Gaiellaceae bacterium]
MTTPIKLERAYDITKVEKQKNKITLDGEMTELSIPILSIVSRGTVEQMLLMIQAFQAASRFAHWTIAKQYVKFEMHLQGTAAATWKTILASNPARTIAQFALFIDMLKKKAIKADDHYHLRNYLRSLKKPRSMDVSEFFQRFSELHTLIREFPNTSEATQFDPPEYKHILFQAMPIEWQKGFTLAGNKVATTDLIDLEEYMIEVETLNSDRPSGKKEKNQKKEGNDTPSQSESSSSEKKKKGRNKKTKKNNTQSGEKRTRLDNDSECPIHGRHKWGKCFDNKLGDNYKLPATSSVPAAASTKGKPSTKGKKDAHTLHTVREGAEDAEDTADNFLCLECTPNKGEVFDLHFFNADMELEAEEYDKSPTKTVITPIQVDLPSKSIEFPSLSSNPRQERENRRKETLELTPETLMTVRRIGETVVRKHFNVLIDTGASVCMIAKSCLPSGIEQLETKSLCFQTTNGIMKASSIVYLCDIHLPEFSKTRSIPEFEAYVYDDASKSSYDLILGRDFLFEIGLSTDFQRRMMSWGEVTVPFHKRGYWRDLSKVTGLLETHPYRVEEREKDLFTSQQIADAKYEAVDPSTIAAQQAHLTEEQRQQLDDLFGNFSNLFNGTLGKYPKSQVHLKLKPNAVPIHSKPFPVPRIHQEAFRHEIERLVQLDVLEKATGSQWACPAFIIPKRDGSARFIADFRNLNSSLERDLCPLPDMRQIIQEQQKFSYITKLDLSMGYFHL